LGLTLLFGSVPARADSSGNAGTPTAWVTFEPFGYAVYPIQTRGGAASYFLAPDRAVALSYEEGRSSRLLETVSAQLWTLEIKSLLGSMTHYDVGLGYRAVSFGYQVAAGGAERTASVQASALVASFSFGNHLQIGPLIFGCDWLGVTIGLKRLSNSQNFPANTDPTEQSGDQHDVDQATLDPALQFMRVFAGFVF
jgi:hypothetical protein